MRVYIINTETNDAKRYQIMIRRVNTFYHVFPGQFFTLDGAIKKCIENGYTLERVGTLAVCFK